MEGFKRCPNGHHYMEKLAECPYCNKNKGGDTANVAGHGDVASTQHFSESAGSDPNKTIIVGEDIAPKILKKNSANNTIINPMGTQFEEEFEEETESGGAVVKRELRSSRRLVGWLVTYSLDPLGLDFRLYEGRNVIGHDADCNITINDKKASGKHAIILFRADKYKIKDNLSTHGTFVNDEDIEDENCELHDGDFIKMGDTIFLFRTSI